MFAAMRFLTALAAFVALAACATAPASAPSAAATAPATTSPSSSSRAAQMLAAAGLTVQDVKRVEGDIVNLYYICTKA